MSICVRSDRRKNWKFEKEGKMKISILIFIYTIPFAYLKVYTKFHNPKSSSCWENSTKNVHMCYIVVTEGKIEKEGKMSFSIFIFIYTIHLWDPGRSGSLPKKKRKEKKFFYFFFRETHFHFVTKQTQAVVTIYYHCILFLLPFHGNSMCNG